MLKTSFDQNGVSLNRYNLRLIPEDVQIPLYNRDDVSAGIVHIGGGSNFFRAHLAVIIDDLLNRGKANQFGICAVNLHSREPIEDLAEQDYLYFVESRDTKTRQRRVIGSIVEALCFKDSPEAVLKKMSSSGIKMFSMTITQKGYCQNTTTGGLDTAHPDIIHDIANPRHPRSAVGLVVEALERRFSAGLPPVTVLSCDNLPENGRLLQKMVVALAAMRKNPDFSDWVAERVAFPVTAVDRITPATTEEFRQAMEIVTGMRDRRPVITEPFSELVIEDKFAGERPPFEEAGVKIVRNPDAFWTRKFRLLNSIHTVIATLAQRMGGAEHMDEAMKNLNGFVRFVMDREITPLLPPEALAGVDEYKDKLIGRFSNAALKDRVDRVGADGERKIPKYILSAIKEALHRGADIDGLCVVAAAWVHNLQRKDEQGRPLDLNDPKANTVEKMNPEIVAAAYADNDGAMASVLARYSNFWGEELASSEAFRKSFALAVKQVGESPIRLVLDSVARVPSLSPHTEVNARPEYPLGALTCDR